MLGSEKAEEPSAAKEKLDLRFVVQDENANEIQECLCIVQSTDKALKVKDFVASALGYNPRYMNWFGYDAEGIDFRKSWKEVFANDPQKGIKHGEAIWSVDHRVSVYGLKGGDMQCAIQEVLCGYDDRNDEEVSPEDADKIIKYLDEEDRTALKKAWAGDASNEWRDLVTEKMTLLGLKKWNEKAKPTERPSILPISANLLDKLAERKEEKDQEDKKKDIKDKEDKKDKKD